MHAVPMLLLVCACGAVAASATPRWACAISEKPAGRHLFPLGDAKSDTERANAEMKDAKLVRSDAAQLSNFAGLTSDKVEAAEEKADAKELNMESSHEIKEAAAQQQNAIKESLQKVLAVDQASLSGVVSAAEAGVLVVFYAPWCGHCKNFVLHGADGAPESAPIEALNSQLLAAKGPKVVKFNVDASPVPAGYDVQYIPTIYLVKKSGEKMTFEGDAGDINDVKSFALGSGAVVALKANATNKASLLQTGGRLHPWAGIAAAAAKLTGKPVRAVAALQTVPAGNPAPIDPHGKNLALASVTHVAEDVSPLGRLSDQLDGSLQVTPVSALSSWVADTPAVRAAPKASLLATYNRDLA